MIKNKLLKKRMDGGFSIVELLVVIVVIAILTAIVVVSYAGITTQANAAKSAQNATSVGQVADVYNQDNNTYPLTAAAFGTYSGTTHLPAGVTVSPGSVTLDKNSGLTTVTWSCLTACSSPLTGGRIGYWDYKNSVTAYVYVGAATSGGTFVNPAT